MSNRDVAPRLRALGERVTKLEGGAMKDHIPDVRKMVESEEGPPDDFGSGEINQAMRDGLCLCCKQKDIENAAIAERLKACEQGSENDSIDYAQSYQLLTADLERARAEVEALTKACGHYRVIEAERDRLACVIGQIEQSKERLKRVMEDAASAPGIDWLFWQLELGKAIKEETP